MSTISNDVLAYTVLGYCDDADAAALNGANRELNRKTQPQMNIRRQNYEALTIIPFMKTLFGGEEAYANIPSLDRLVEDVPNLPQCDKMIRKVALQYMKQNGLSTAKVQRAAGTVIIFMRMKDLITNLYPVEAFNTTKYERLEGNNVREAYVNEYRLAHFGNLWTMLSTFVFRTKVSGGTESSSHRSMNDFANDTAALQRLLAGETMNGKSLYSGQ